MREQTIKKFAAAVLSVEEIRVARRLHYLVRRRDKIGWICAWSLIIGILPKFWIRLHGNYVTVHPISVYRPVYYVSSPRDYTNDTRPTIINLAEHIEGLLAQLAPDRAARILPFGRLVDRLMSLKLIPGELGGILFQYNSLVNIPAKHPKANPMIPERLDIRTFSTWDTLLCLMLTRHLAIQLSEILKERGLILPANWKPFNKRWVNWPAGGKKPMWGRPRTLDPLGNYYNRRSPPPSNEESQEHFGD